MKITKSLIKKYNVPTPRYTSYPTVPLWENKFESIHDWMKIVKRTFDETNEDQGISLYIHLPYCESLCTYCACNTRITKNHKVEAPYIDSILTEWRRYLTTFGEAPIIRELHLGGGTPTFFSPESLHRLVNSILSSSRIHPERAFSFEGHPNNTSREHLQTLYDLGFRRVSYGVQDLDFKVQKTINRIQPFENLVRATDEARSIGYTSVNFDLIYGLPYQTSETVADTISRVLALRPERIAFYSYAHVPWKRPGQRAYDEADLPTDSVKRALYEVGKALLIEHNYTDVGMDHFALPGDELYVAYQNKTMHRNFMGYTDASTDLLIGLGVSAISDAKYAYLQNVKVVEHYRDQVTKKEMDWENGHILSDKDFFEKGQILDIACSAELRWESGEVDLDVLIRLNEMAAEGLIELYDKGFRVTELGMAFLRNICSVFDKRMHQKRLNDTPVFSKAI
ncbi:oxygen-independent coproporphyrinogen III oxidase [Fulvivirga sp. M361]|uniref:oxygen-independent coproporphyrinogen III oxidase n=1 Tax=Fulvivirga sp. M361 TaxID=2594266 RepID=UPI00117BD781|nr:oxygen-independent coproporphyrinogen III oxidase [Fulvivirga sp. M361]TRX52660.1 oxygen-independent coproporphyrinogen III oxidase [Fulvivirga sp. M361]